MKRKKSLKVKMVMTLIVLLIVGITSCEKDETTTETDDDNNVNVILPDISGYPIVGTNQTTYYNNSSEISATIFGEAFYGQNANYQGTTPSYHDNGDGTITDLVTGLMWSQTPDMDENGDIDVDDKMTYDEAASNASSYDIGAYNDWRLPTIKELYSLIIFSGVDPSGFEGTSTEGLVPFIDTNYFDFAYGDTDAGERIIDAQYATTSMYVDGELLFGVNFADGRIKGYPKYRPESGAANTMYFRMVRGNIDYGKNNSRHTTNIRDY